MFKEAILFTGPWALERDSGYHLVLPLAWTYVLNMQSLEERHQAGNLFRSPFLQNTRAISCNNRGARYQATVAQFSAVPSTLRIRFPTAKPRARQGSILWVVLYRSLKTVSNPRKHGPSGIFLSRAGHPSPWVPAFCFLVCLESLSF